MEQQAPGEFFTRGALNAPDTRGQSMVAKHLDKLQKEKEHSAMDKLNVLLPQLSPAVRALALQEVGWEADLALAMLQRFMSNKTAELGALHAQRKRHKAEVDKERKGAESGSSSSGESDSGSDSSEEERSRSKGKGRRSSKDHRKRSHKEGSRDKKKRRREKAKADDKDRKRRRKDKDSKKTRSKRDDGKGRSTIRAANEQYGRYGIIRETDAYNKRPEFALWALEVKKQDIDLLPKFEERELFSTFMEDFNTATLPHRKYYDVDAYDRERAAKAAARGGAVGEERSAFDDEAERRKELQAQRQREQAERLQAAYLELTTTDKAEEMRQQEFMRAKMSLAYRTGDQKEALRLAERLKPDDMKAPAEAARLPRPPAAGT